MSRFWAILGAVIVSALATHAGIGDLTLAEQWAQLRAAPTPFAAKSFARADAPRTSAAMAIAAEARQLLGERWVTPALKIAKVESGYRCGAIGPRTRHGRAAGLMQVLPASAEALEPGSSAHLTDCATGARVGVKHMRACLDAGATTPQLMAACHVAGVRGFRARLSRSASRYRTQYVRMVDGAVPIVVADASGWLARGSVAINGER